jgi:hypothetical protein
VLEVSRTMEFPMLTQLGLCLRRTFPIAWHKIHRHMTLHIFVLSFFSILKHFKTFSLSLSLIYVSSSSSHFIPYSLAFHSLLIKAFQAMDLASNIGGKIEKDDVLSAVEKCVSLYHSLVFFFLSFFLNYGLIVFFRLWLWVYVLLISLYFSYMK